MSETAGTDDFEDTVPEAADLLPPEVVDDGVREVSLFSKDFDGPGFTDFRPQPVTIRPDGEVEEFIDPKDSFALASAGSSQSSRLVETVKPSESSASQEQTANAEKASTPPKGDEPTGTQIF